MTLNSNDFTFIALLIGLVILIGLSLAGAAVIYVSMNKFTQAKKVKFLPTYIGTFVFSTVAAFCLLQLDEWSSLSNFIYTISGVLGGVLGYFYSYKKKS